MFRLQKYCSRLSAAAVLGTAALSAFAADPIKVGWLSSLTGPLSSAALAENEGVKFAVEEINKAGGINGRPIELLTRDTAGDPDQGGELRAAAGLQRERSTSSSDQVNSGEGLAAAPIIARAGIPNLVIGAIDELIDPAKYPRAFRVINTNRQWISTANDYALNTLEEAQGGGDRRHLRLRHLQREDRHRAAEGRRHRAGLLGADRSEQDGPERRDEQGPRRPARRS
jgi:branched-chain amino acid transport system substrate-binding protein